MPAAVRPADPELRHAMLGMTEAGSVCLASEDESEQPEHRRGSFGRAVPGFEAKVRGARTARTCATGEVGELCFRGPFLMEGYDGRERHETFDADDWFHTGDLVTVDDDGFFYFRGRESDMIKTAGANVSPREVEAAILEVSGLVAHVVGIDDEARGQVVAALVRARRRGASTSTSCASGCAGRLSAYKVPRRVVVGPDGRGPDDVERQARPAGAQGAARCATWADETGGRDDPGAAGPPARRRRRPAGPRHGGRGASPMPSSTKPAPRWRPGSSARRRRQGRPGRRCWRRTGSSGRSSRCAVMRIGAVLVPLSTLLRPPELLAQIDGGVTSSHLVTAPEFRDRRYLDELEDGGSRTRASVVRAGRAPPRPRRRCAGCGRPTASRDAGAGRPGARAGAAGAAGRRHGRPVHVGQPRGARRA